MSVDKPQENGRDAEVPSPTENDRCLPDTCDTLEVKPTGGKKRGPAASMYERSREKTGLSSRRFLILIGLLIVILFLVIVVIVLAALWPSLPHHKLVQVCTRSACLSASAEMLPKMDSSVEPCDDFWNFACGGWLKRNAIPPTKSKWNVFEDLSYRAHEKIHSIITTLPQPTDMSSLQWKVKYFYESCMNLDSVESDGKNPLQKIITELGGWNVLRDFSFLNWDQNRAIQRLHSEYGVSPFFKISVVVDARNPKQNIIKISPSGLGLPDKSFYERDPDASVVQSYKTFLRDIVRILGATTTDAKVFSENVFHFEKRIAEITPTIEELEDPFTTYNRMNISRLREMSTTVPWFELLQAMFPSANIQASTEVIVTSREYLKHISAIISSTQKSVLNDYVMWILTSEYLPYLTKDLRDSVDQYWQETTGTSKPLERWEMCVMTTQKYLGFGVMALYDQHIKSKAESEKVLQDIFKDIRYYIQQAVYGATWYQQKLKDYLLDKLNGMTLEVGYPSFMLENTYLKNFYSMFQVQRNNFFQNIRYGTTFLREAQERNYINPTKESGWMPALLKNEISYVPSSNKVVIPHHLLVPPLFHPHYLTSILYGGIGVRIANAVVTGITQWDVLYNADGRLADAYRINATLKSSSSARVCMMNFLISKNFTGLDIIKRTAINSVIHTTAVKQSQLALNQKLTNAEDVHQPALETYENDALFFLSYAQTMCSSSTLQQRDRDSAVDFHLPEEIQMKTTVMQLQRFSDAFHCSSSSSLYASNPCVYIL